MATSHDQRRGRRKSVARMISDNKSSVSEVCELFGVSASLVQVSCKEFGVTIPNKTLKRSSFAVVARLQNTSFSFDKIGEDLNISRQRVHQIYCEAQKAGIRFLRCDKDRGGDAV